MTATTRRGLMLMMAAALASGAAVAPAAAQGRDVLIFAAASLKNALDDVAAQWQRSSGKKVVVSYAASNVLVRQIEQGAPADMVISADLDWMDYAERKNLIRPETRLDLLGNRIVLVAPKESTVDVAIGPGFDLAAPLAGGRLAMGAVETVPAGRYGKAALETLGAWDGVKDRLAPAENVRAALAFVARGEAPLGIVYRTDAASDPRVRVVGVFPEDSHPPIVYPVALTRSSANPDAAPFLQFMQSGAARAAFEKQGFTAPGRP